MRIQPPFLVVRYWLKNLGMSPSIQRYSARFSPIHTAEFITDATVKKHPNRRAAGR
jgi:hypothetical protein